MWSGTDEDYFRLYRMTATAIRRDFPDLKIGGPAVGASGRFVNGEFHPTEFVTNFLKLCRAESLPLDFFSWHCYTADPAELVSRARAIRVLLDEQGFTRTESHLNEWNFLPGNSWEPLSRNSPAPARQRYYEEMAGPPGAAFIASALIELQDAPLDVANLFHGELGAFGLFNEFGVPQKNYHALLAFRGLLAAPQRVKATGGVAGQLAIAAGLSANRSEARVLISNFNHPQSDLRVELAHLPWRGGTQFEVLLVDAQREFEPVEAGALGGPGGGLNLKLASSAVALIRLRSAR